MGMSLGTVAGRFRELAFTVPGRPVPWARARSKGARRFEPQRQRDHRELIEAEALAAWLKVRRTIDVPRLITAPVSVDVLFVYRLPKRPTKVLPAGKPDVDNLLKLVLDALPGTLLADDALVVDVSGRKRYGEDRDEPERTVITVSVDVDPDRRHP